MYTFLHNAYYKNTPTPETLEQKFPELHHSLLKESLCNLVNQPLNTLPKNQYIEEPTNKPISLPYIDQTTAPQNQLTLITWNVDHLYTTIPNMIRFLKNIVPPFSFFKKLK